MDETLLKAWASVKSFRSRDEDLPSGGGGRNSEVDFRGERRSNETHQPTTDPEARPAKKGSIIHRVCGNSWSYQTARSKRRTLANAHCCELASKAIDLPPPIADKQSLAWVELSTS